MDRKRNVFTSGAEKLYVHIDVDWHCMISKFVYRIGSIWLREILAARTSFR